MASSEVKICNMALGRVGVSIFIDALTESSQAAVVCNQFYESSRDRALVEGRFNFATTRATLADLGTPPTNWSYRYALPSDCLDVQRIVTPGIRNPLAKNRIPFELAEEAGARVLYTDQAQAELVYTKRVTNPNLFSPQFESALAWLLASEITMPLAAAPNLATNAFKRYLGEISAAQAASLNEAQEDVEPDSEFISGRN